MSEVFCLKAFVLETFLVAVEDDVVWSYASRYIFFGKERYCLLLRKTRHEVAEERGVDVAVLFDEQMSQ